MSEIHRYLFADYNESVVDAIREWTRSYQAAKIVTPTDFKKLMVVSKSRDSFEQEWIHYGLGPEDPNDLKTFYCLLEKFYQRGGLTVTTNEYGLQALQEVRDNLSWHGMDSVHICGSIQAMDELKALIRGLR